MNALKLRKIGNSYGVILPRDVLEHLRAGEDSSLYLTKTPDGIAITTVEDASFADAMAAFARGRVKFRNALRELAK